MPASYDCRAFGFEDGQSGLFYDTSLNILLRGRIIEFMLNATVVHDGSDYDKGRYFAAFSLGYKYDDWDLSQIIHFPEDILTMEGYLRFINNPNVTYKHMDAYFKAKRLLIESLTKINKNQII